MVHVVCICSVCMWGVCVHGMLYMCVCGIYYIGHNYMFFFHTNKHMQYSWLVASSKVLIVGKCTKNIKIFSEKKSMSTHLNLVIYPKNLF